MRPLAENRATRGLRTPQSVYELCKLQVFLPIFSSALRLCTESLTFYNVKNCSDPTLRLSHCLLQPCHPSLHQLISALFVERRVFAIKLPSFGLVCLFFRLPFFYFSIFVSSFSFLCETIESNITNPLKHLSFVSTVYARLCQQ